MNNVNKNINRYNRKDPQVEIWRHARGSLERALDEDRAVCRREVAREVRREVRRGAALLVQWRPGLAQAPGPQPGVHHGPDPRHREPVEGRRDRDGVRSHVPEHEPVPGVQWRQQRALHDAVQRVTARAPHRARQQRVRPIV